MTEISVAGPFVLKIGIKIFVLRSLGYNQINTYVLR